jgi:hypothetical protein
MSQKSTVKCRRSLGAPDISTERDDLSRLGAAVRERHNSADVKRLAPQSPQNLLLAGLVAPHREHVIGNLDPHCVQKRFVCGLSALQLTHFIEGALYNGRWSGGARGRGLLRLDIRLTNNFTPFLRFIGYELGEIGR